MNILKKACKEAIVMRCHVDHVRKCISGVIKITKQFDNKKM